MDIGLYEDWMKPQVAKLFSIQYGIAESDFSRLIDNFYELPFQKNKCIRIVATEGKTVIGFQSFFYWPYTLSNKIYNSYQSGNSLVHPDHRGKGIFQKLLNYLDLHREELKIDFLIGFPIDVSVGSLLRNNWLNIFNLQWYIRPINPFSAFLPLNRSSLKRHFPNSSFPAEKQTDIDQIRLLKTPEFNTWRSTHYNSDDYFAFHFSKDNKELVLKLKVNIRKKIIKELIIGDIMTSSYEPDFLNMALDAFFQKLRKVHCITLVSIALNERSDNTVLQVLLAQRFKRINKQIYFCMKPFSSEATLQSIKKWVVYRSDIDTW